MKSLVLLCVLIVVVFSSCNSEDREPHYNVLGYWDVVMVRLSQDDELLIGEQIRFSERYIFNDDGTFIKFTTRNSRTSTPLPEPLQALGHYHVEESTDEAFVYELELTFQTNLMLSNGCGEVGTEYLKLTKGNNLVHDKVTSCGGVEFFYSKQASRF
ncbi:hypothetical protein MM239_13080 [Belliella sp. DSM 111904]|uniref:Lipocalin-like domain-containing protein n=1 Tax=Belliella filtrata TaxID=2923435 RepID=A0ABS9V292_9BACT|nr:hypothetical protein [Belliella filtrata]MCH7410334.1 hypothetical protein [Belliella filtrata]